MKFMLTSTAFEEGQPIPRQYTHDGENFSPPVKWFDPPEAATPIKTPWVTAKVQAVVKTTAGNE